MLALAHAGCHRIRERSVPSARAPQRDWDERNIGRFNVANSSFWIGNTRLSGCLVALWIAAISGCVRNTGFETSIRPAHLPDMPDGPISTSNEPAASFVLDGQPFCFAGTNNYYLTYKSRRMTDDVLESMKRLGLRVVRIWGNIDRGSLDGTVGNIDGAGDKDGVYFQYWNAVDKRPAYNDGPSGLEHLDYVLTQARALDLKVIIVLTNNWKDFGGMDQYVLWFGLKQHDDFFTDSKARDAFKGWTAHLVNRRNSITGVPYRDDPTIFGWELANEPRCWNGGDFDDRSKCTDTRPITTWADEMSTYVKAIDQRHLVAVGDEGFFKGGTDWGYDGADGIDHRALLDLPHIDFGTYHLYPDTWGQSLEWSERWIERHIAAARKAGKPALLEEYGIVASRSDAGIVVDPQRREAAYARWHDIIVHRGGNGALFWMLAGRDDMRRAVPDYDHFTVYDDEHNAPFIRSFATAMTKNAQACTLYRRLTPAGSIARSPFVTTAPPPGGPSAELVSHFAFNPGAR